MKDCDKQNRADGEAEKALLQRNSGARSTREDRIYFKNKIFPIKRPCLYKQ